MSKILLISFACALSLSGSLMKPHCMQYTQNGQTNVTNQYPENGNEVLYIIISPDGSSYPTSPDGSSYPTSPDGSSYPTAPYAPVYPNQNPVYPNQNCVSQENPSHICVGNTLACITGCVLSGPTLLALLLALC